MSNSSITEITIVERINNNKFVLSCACCNGSGKMAKDHDNNSPYVICTVCDGRGVAVVEIINGSLPFIECPVCKGSGEQSRDLDNRSPYIICKKCLGIGARPIAGEMKILN